MNKNVFALLEQEINAYIESLSSIVKYSYLVGGIITGIIIISLISIGFQNLKYRVISEGQDTMNTIIKILLVLLIAGIISSLINKVIPIKGELTLLIFLIFGIIYWLTEKVLIFPLGICHPFPKLENKTELSGHYFSDEEILFIKANGVIKGEWKIFIIRKNNGFDIDFAEEHDIPLLINSSIISFEALKEWVSSAENAKKVKKVIRHMKRIPKEKNRNILKK